MKYFLFITMLISLLFGELLSQSASFEGITYTGKRPPDPVIAAGPSHIILVANSELEIYTKSGSKLYESTLSNFFSSQDPPGDPFDPKIVFDHYSQRFVIFALTQNTARTESYYLIAASSSSDPTGSWYKLKQDAMSYEGTYKYYADFTGLGYDETAIYLTSNQLYSGETQHSKIRALRKSKLYSGNNPDIKDFKAIENGNGTKVKNIKPAHQFGSSSTFYLMNTVQSNSQNFINIWKLTNPFDEGSILVKDQISIVSYENPPNAVQKDNPNTIDVLDSRISDVVYRDGYLYAAFSAMRPGGNGSVIRYLKIYTVLNTVVWDGNYGNEAGIFYYYPEVYPDGDGNVVMVFNKSSVNDYVGIGFTYRLTTEDSFRNSSWLKQGEVPYYNLNNGVN